MGGGGGGGERGGGGGGGGGGSDSEVVAVAAIAMCLKSLYSFRRCITVANGTEQMYLLTRDVI